MRRGMILLVAMVLILGACGDDGPIAETTTGETTSTTAGDTTSTTAGITTSTTAGVPQPAGTAFIMNGETGAYVWALQTYLDCAGYGPITIDGVFGSGTAASVERAQADEHKTATGEPDEETFARLSRACFENRDIVFGDGATSSEVAGNAAPGDDEMLQIRVVAGQQMTVRVDGGVDVAIQGADGHVLHRPDGAAEITVDIPDTQDYLLRVSAAEPTSYLLTITIPEIPEATTSTTLAVAAGFLLASDGLNEIDFGMESEDALAALSDEFGAPGTDTGWVDVEPSPGADCASTARTVTWVFASSGQMPSTTLEVMLHDLGFSNPAFAYYDYRLTDAVDPGHAGGVLSTADGLTLGVPYREALTYGYLLGGYEETSHGSKDGLHFRVWDNTLGEDDGYLGSFEAGQRECYFEEP